jgi:hypothetical protein
MAAFPLSGWAAPRVARLPDRRLHLQHGPIDLVIGAEGDPDDLARAEQAARDRFGTILIELTDELAFLRRRLRPDFPDPDEALSPVARRMVAACRPHAAAFITPMAAVAGSVADEIRDVMLATAPGIRALHVNNGGDISVHVGPGATLRIGVVSDLVSTVPDGTFALQAGSGVGGVATSGWRGRSFSLGIADAVTVLAGSAAAADAAATMIANRVNVVHPLVQRAPARSLDPDSDLGGKLVTTDVGRLPAESIERALDAGAAMARRLLAAGLMEGALLALAGRWRIVTPSAGAVAALRAWR